MSDLLTTARHEAVAEIQSALSKAAADALKRHGDDPRSIELLLAGVVSFLEKTEVALPGFRERVVEMLTKDGER